MFIENHMVLSTKVFWIAGLWTGPNCCLEASCLGKRPCKCTFCACCTFALTASDSSSDPKYIPHFATEEKKWMDLERSDRVDLGIFHVNAKDLEWELGPQYLHWNRQNVPLVETSWKFWMKRKSAVKKRTSVLRMRAECFVRWNLCLKELVLWRSDMRMKFQGVH